MDEELSFSTEDDEKKHVETKRKWTHAETSAFLTAYAKRKHEFLDSRMKKYAMKNVLLDLINQAAITSPITIGMLNAKLKNLWRSYKNGKNNTLKIPFQSQMDSIFGNFPKIDNSNFVSEMLGIDVSTTTEDVDSEESECIEARRKWTHEETVAFLTTYAERKDEFLHVRKKKFAMENVLEDLINRNVLTQPTNVDMLNAKIKSLWRAYKHAKLNAIKTGTSLASIAFENQLEAIFGDRATESNRHSVSLTEMPVKQLSKAAPEEHERYQRSTSEEHVSKKKRKSNLPKYLENKLELKKRYLEQKIQIKKEAEINKQKRHADKVKILYKFLDKFRNEK